MESLKKPETMISVGALIGVGASYFYLNKKITSLNQRVDEFDKHLSAVIKKLTESAKSSSNVNDNLKELSSSLGSMSSTLKNLDLSVYDMKEENDLVSERINALFEGFRAAGNNIEDPLDEYYKPKKVKGKNNRRNDHYESGNRRRDDRDDREDRRNDREDRRNDREDRRNDREDRRGDRDNRRQTEKNVKFSKGKKVIESDSESDDEEFIQKISANNS
jgi:uncharacterized coiled-coil protein SlyX